MGLSCVNEGNAKTQLLTCFEVLSGKLLMVVKTLEVHGDGSSCFLDGVGKSVFGCKGEEVLKMDGFWYVGEAVL